MEKKIYALFEYYGDGMMVTQNYLCIKYGTPEEILQWLLSEGYLSEVLYYGRMMGTPSDRPYLKRIEKLQKLSTVTSDTIRKIDLRMPSCCTCRAICESMSEMPEFSEKVREMVLNPNVGTVMSIVDVIDFLKTMEESAESEDKYTDFANCLPERYL